MAISRSLICRALGLTFLLVACTKSYPDPVFETYPATSSDAFAGIVELAETRPGETLRVLSTHGMCSQDHRKNWVTRRANLFGAALVAAGKIDSWAPLDPNKITHDISYPRGADDEGVKEREGLVRPAIRRYVLPVTLAEGGTRIEFTFFTWGSFNDVHREMLAYDSKRRDADNPEEPKRATVNHGLKSVLLNQCLVDAVVYAGQNGNRLRDQLSNAVCEALGGRGAGQSCQLPGGAAAQTTVLLTESLGSTVLFDALASIEDPDLAETLGGLPAIYMISNQLPLIHRANVPPKIDAAREFASQPKSSLGALLSRVDRGGFRGATEMSGAARTIVAFSDPNDLFSYRLNPEFLNLGAGVADTKFVNVLTSNAGTLFGLLENPEEAHAGYECNTDVVGMTIMGSNAKRGLVSRRDLCKDEEDATN